METAVPTQPTTRSSTSSWVENEEYLALCNDLTMKKRRLSAIILMQGLKVLVAVNHLKNDDAECGRQEVDQSVEEDGELEEEGGVAA